jgi:hypothetical protein
LRNSAAATAKVYDWRVVELLAAVLAVAALPWCGDDGPAMHDTIGGRFDYQCASFIAIPKIADNQVRSSPTDLWFTRESELECASRLQPTCDGSPKNAIKCTQIA